MLTAKILMLLILGIANLFFAMTQSENRTSKSSFLKVIWYLQAFSACSCTTFAIRYLLQSIQ